MRIEELRNKKAMPKEIVKVKRYFPEGADDLIIDCFEINNIEVQTIEIIPQPATHEELIVIECEKKQEELVKSILWDIFLDC